jgi:hypothetical protein
MSNATNGTKSRKHINNSYNLGQRRCYCGRQLVYNPHQSNSATFEHLVPKSQGGTFHYKNHIIACQKCNKARGNMCWVKWVNKHNFPKKEWLLNKYAEALLHYQQDSRKLVINSQRATNIINVYLTTTE